MDHRNKVAEALEEVVEGPRLSLLRIVGVLHRFFAGRLTPGDVLDLVALFATLYLTCALYSAWAR